MHPIFRILPAPPEVLLHPSSSAEADGHLSAFHNNRDLARAFGMFQHHFQLGAVLVHPVIFHIVAAAGIIVSGVGGVVSGVLTVNEYFRHILPLFILEYVSGLKSKKILFAAQGLC